MGRAWLGIAASLALGARSWAGEPEAPSTVREAQPEDAVGEPEATATFEIRAPMDVPPPGTSLVRRRQWETAPGSFGDPVRALANRAGVGRTPLGLGALILRGTAAEDSAYSVDGLDVPIVFHFAGTTTVLPGALVERVSFSPGLFSVRQGRNLGGRVDLGTPAELPWASSGEVGLDLFQASAWGSFRTSRDSAVSVGVRRSWIDAVLTPVLSGPGNTFRAPRYWDAQLGVQLRPGRGHALDVLYLGVDDRFVSGPEVSDTVVPTLGLRTTFSRVRLRWAAPLGPGATHALSVLIGPDRQDFSFRGAVVAEERRTGVQVREELTLTGRLGLLRLGADLAAREERWDLAVPGFGAPEVGGAVRADVGAWIEGDIGGPRWWLVGGARMDAFTATRASGERFGWSAVSVDPRIMGSVSLGTSGFDLRFGAGRFSQAPPSRALQEGLATDGRVGLAGATKGELGLGWFRAFGDDLVSARVTGWVSGMDGLVLGREERFRFFVVPPPTGDLDTSPWDDVGRGLAAGAEVEVSWERPRLRLQVAGTFSRSLRTRRDGTWEPWAYDQPVVVAVVASGLAGRGWRLGARFRAASGTPYTPVVQRIYELGSRLFLPVFGDRQSARLAPYVALDLRVDKVWTFGWGQVTLFLDVLNVTNSRPVEVMAWTWDYREEAGVRGLPVLPVFGLRLDL